MQEYGYGRWDLVILNVILFGLFTLTIPLKRKTSSHPKSIYLAFVIALYTEMYGFPLTIYILTWLFGYRNPLTHMAGHLWAELVGEDIFFLFFHTLSVFIIILGAALIIVGWQKIHASGGHLVTDGIYSFVRHPQYLGFLLLTLGMLLQWVTIPTALMWPVLAVLYHRLAKEEEKELEERFGEEYLKYKRRVSMFIPFP